MNSSEGCIVNSQSPIGVFDSGVGGLTVYKSIRHALPGENLVYLGDTARVPYGTKSPETVLRYAREICNFLVRHDVKLIVIACNTASAFALEDLQKELTIPIVGVIEPGAAAAKSATKNNRVGIIGTEGTIRSGVYERALKRLDENIQCYSKATGLLVPLIEEAVFVDGVLSSVFDHYLQDFSKKDVDVLVLGCTHYPILKQQFQDYFSNTISLVDSAETTAEQVCRIINQKQLANSSSMPSYQKIMVTDTPDRAQEIARMILGPQCPPLLRVSLTDD